eukprot:TRINITY_DN7829_c4_g1_i1.p1 TRINITY_DN7829_c4_g1~~TRINITY_DN7829_c4_g1_i1.p1  ORF type:complete len:480 (+),score=42.82 TRINITY_DN7829_c4_g1_i1:132-1571(+)
MATNRYPSTLYQKKDESTAPADEGLEDSTCSLASTYLCRIYSSSSLEKVTLEGSEQSWATSDLSDSWMQYPVVLYGLRKESLIEPDTDEDAGEESLKEPNCPYRVCIGAGHGCLLLGGWVTIHKYGLLNRSARRWVAIRDTELVVYTKPFSEELSSYSLYLAKTFHEDPSPKLVITGAFLPKGCLEMTTASCEDASVWCAAIREATLHQSPREVKPALNKTPTNTSFADRQKLREDWLTEHLTNFYMTEVPERVSDVPKVVQAFVFHELRLYMRMIGRYSNRAQDLDFLLDPPEETLPASTAQMREDVTEVMWRYHWLEGHLASFYQKYEPDQRKEASRIAAVHLGREDLLRCTLLQRYPGCNFDVAFLLDAPTLDPQGWRDSTELYNTISSALDSLQDNTGQANINSQAPPTTILPLAFQRWCASLCCAVQDCAQKKSVRFDLSLNDEKDPPLRRTESFTKSIKHMLRMGQKENGKFR